MGRNKKKTNLTHFKLRYYYLLVIIVVIVVIIIVLVIIIAVVIVIDVVCCVVVLVVVIFIVVVFLLLLFTVCMCYDSNYIKGENGKHITIATAIKIVVRVSTPQLCGSFLLQYECTRRGIEREWNCMV